MTVTKDKHYFRDYRARKRAEREALKAKQIPATVLAALLDPGRCEHEARTRELQTISYGWGNRKLIGERSAAEIVELREAAERRVVALRTWMDGEGARDFDSTPNEHGTPGTPGYTGKYDPGALDDETERAAIRELLALEECLAELDEADAIQGVNNGGAQV